MNLNCWIGSGRLTRDAELGQSRKGTSMSKFRIASNGRRDDETLFMNVLCFGKMAESRDLLERALHMMEIGYGPEHRKLAFVLSDLGEVYGRLGDPSRRVERLERSLQI